MRTLGKAATPAGPLGAVRLGEVGGVVCVEPSTLGDMASSSIGSVWEPRSPSLEALSSSSSGTLTAAGSPLSLAPAALLPSRAATAAAASFDAAWTVAVSRARLPVVVATGLRFGVAGGESTADDAAGGDALPAAVVAVAARESVGDVATFAPPVAPPLLLLLAAPPLLLLLLLAVLVPPPAVTAEGGSLADFDEVSSVKPLLTICAAFVG